jgi:Tol biopolymer transport system component/imidazolonepropionase-like amidohydrolase
MSVDVSPDGRTIVFDLLGDLYTVPISGGNAARITTGMALNRQPRYSPDGRHLAFVSDRGGSENVWIADRNGHQARQLSKLQGYDGPGAVTSPEWSPDGQTIVVSQRLGAARAGGATLARNQRWLLAAYELRTGRMRWISDTVPDRARATLGPAFGPHREVVYTAVDVFREVPWVGLANWRIAEVDVSTGRIQPLMGDDVGRIGVRPVASPDGHYLVYASSSGSRMGLRLRDLRTGRERWLVQEVFDNPPPPYVIDSRDLIPGYSFTPQSAALIVAYQGKIHRIDLMTGRASVIPFAADVERRLGPLAVHQFRLPDTAVRTRNVMQPALSPDGGSVAFSALDRIWLMELPRDGRAARPPRRLTADSVGEFYPSWSPDGQWIAYSTWQDGEGGAVRRARARLPGDASPPPSERLTTDTALFFHTAVAPNGRRVFAVRVALPPDRLLTDSEVLVGAPSLRPVLGWVMAGGGPFKAIASLAALESNGSRYPVDPVYFTADSGRVHVGLTSCRLDGTDRQTGPTFTDPERRGDVADGPADIAGVFSPDRQRVLAVHKYTLFELLLPKRRYSSGGRAADTLDFGQAQATPITGAPGVTHPWGTALEAWISWSRDGHRVLFSQGGTLFLGDVQPDRWTTFTPINVPLTAPVDVPRGTLVLHGARLITMRQGEVIEHGDLVIRDNRIMAIGAVGHVPIPRDARVLDLTGMTVLPGYVDLHDHMALPKGIHAGQCWQCLAALAYGVTTARDPQPGLAVDVFTYRERERSGDLLGPRVFSTGIPYFGTDRPLRTLDDARDAVRANAENFRSETFKVYYDQATDRRTRQLLAIATAEQRLNATAHTNGMALVLANVIDGLSGIEHGPNIEIYEDLATLIARSGTTYTQTYGVRPAGAFDYMFRRYNRSGESAKLFRFMPSSIRVTTHGWLTQITSETLYGPPELDALRPLLAGAARIVAKGGRVGIGAHGEIPGLGYHYEMWLHALGGSSNHDILRSATIVGADALGHAADLGSLQRGKLADLQVLARNPLADIHNTMSVRCVMKNGRLYRTEDLAEIWPRKKRLAAIYRQPPLSAHVAARVGRAAVADTAEGSVMCQSFRRGRS